MNISRRLLLFFACLNCSISVPVHAQTWLTNGLVAYYDFNLEVADISGNGNYGVNNGATFATDRFGNPNNAISFSNNIVTTSFFPPVGAAPRTISGWFLAGTSSSEMALFSYGGNPNGTGTRIEADVQSDGSLRIDMSNGSFSTDTTGYNDSNWHQFAVVVPADQSATNVVIYIDGSVQGMMTGQTNFVDTIAQTPLEFGQFYGDSRPYTGLLDDVRVFNRDLSADEVQQLYQYELQNETPSPWRGALATGSVINGFFVGVTVDDGGSDYTNVPGVHIFGGGGSGAQAVAVVSNGVVVAINVLGAGSNYVNVPQVTVDPPVVLNPSLNIQPVTFLVFSNLSVGFNYQLQILSSNSWVDQSDSFTATNPVYQQIVAGLPGSACYQLAVVSPPTQAAATPQVANGFLVGINISDGGAGYASAPTVQITDATGTGATATAQVSGAGAVTNITINAAGSGYTSTPSIVISAPTTVSTIPPTASPGMRLDCFQLFPFTNCQIQVSSNPGTTWNNWSDGLFVPSATTNSLFYSATNSAGYFRLEYTP